MKAILQTLTIGLTAVTLLTPIARSASAPASKNGSVLPLPPGYPITVTADSSYKDKDGFYKVPPFFSPYPKANDKKGWLIKNFGPVGIGITIKAPGMTLEITTVENGSPAEKIGKLKKGQIIESINGIVLRDIDPRIILASIITEVEAADGKVVLKIKDLGDVPVQIPVMGRYSATWPLNCPKSDKIVRNLADLLAKQGKTEWGSVLFLLSTGEEKDLDVVRGWMKNRKEIGSINWTVGIEGIGVCEYYLRTGDASVLPMIQKGADHLRDRIYNGAWAGRGASFNYQSGGHMNAAGVHCLTFLMLAKTCGVTVDEKTLQSSLSHFFNYSGKGSVPYGDYVPKPGYGDCNGKTGGFALSMAAAARLTPDGENSIYAKSAQISAMKAYYGTHVYHMGHTGGGIGEIWKSTSMGLMADKRPKQYREYMDARRWMLELARRHTGAIGIAGGQESNYDQASGEKLAWGTFNALNYTLPRKRLHLFGAPLSKWAKSYQLPQRPAGSTAADDDFSSPFSVPGGSWSKDDIFKETLMEHSGWAVSGQVCNDKVTDKTLLTYLHHPEITHRFEAMGAMLKFKKDAILLELLRSKDSRVRHVGIMAIHELLGTWRSSSDEQKRRATPEIMVEVDKIIRNPQESAFVRGWALGLLQHADLARLRTFRELLVDLMEKGSVQGQVSAMHTSIPLLADKESYQIIFPPMMRAISAATSYPAVMSTSSKISKAMEQASPEIQAYGLKQLKTVFGELPNNLVSKDTGIYVIPDGATAKRKSLGISLGFSEEGRQFMKAIPKTTLKSYISGKESDMFRFSGTFKNDKKYVGTWVWAVWPPAKLLGEIDARIQEWLKKTKGNVDLKNSKDTIELRADGTVLSRAYYGEKNRPGQYFWTENTIFGVSKGEAYQMEIRTYDGYDFLIIECGGFAPVIPKEGEVEATAVPANYHCGYHIYMRKKSSEK
jgi:hypothetical protein